MPAFERPSAISSSTSRSRGRQVVDRARAAAAEQLRDDLRVERGAARADAAHGLDEVVDVHHAVLQQVADAARRARAGEQLGRVGALDVLRDDEDRGLGRGAPQLERGAQALVAEGRRQADVDDRDVRLLQPHRVHERVAVVDRRRRPRSRSPRAAAPSRRAGARGPRRSRPARQLHAHDRRPARRARHGERPVERLDPPAQAGEPAAGGIGAAAPVVLDLHARAGRRAGRPRPRSRLAPECFAAFASASATTKYAADSTAGGSRSSSVDRHRHRQHAAVGERRERRAEPAVGEHGRMDPAREVAQLLQRLADADARLGDELLRALGVATRASARRGRGSCRARRAGPARRRGGRARCAAARRPARRRRPSASPRARRRGARAGCRAPRS